MDKQEWIEKLVQERQETELDMIPDEYHPYVEIANLLIDYLEVEEYVLLDVGRDRVYVIECFDCIVLNSFAYDPIVIDEWNDHNCYIDIIEWIHGEATETCRMDFSMMREIKSIPYVKSKKVDLKTQIRYKTKEMALKSAELKELGKQLEAEIKKGE